MISLNLKDRKVLLNFPCIVFITVESQYLTPTGKISNNLDISLVWLELLK